MNRVTFSSAKSGAILPNGILPPTHNSGNISKLLCWVNPGTLKWLLALIFNPTNVRLSEELSFKGQNHFVAQRKVWCSINATLESS